MIRDAKYIELVLRDKNGHILISLNKQIEDFPLLVFKLAEVLGYKIINLTVSEIIP